MTSSDAQRSSGYELPDPLFGYPTTCVSFQIPDSREYRAAVRALVYRLGKWWTWKKSFQPGDTRASQVATLFRMLLDQTLTFNDECFPDVSGCQEHAPSSYIIEWNPNDPFKTPDLVPDGYAFPPWYQATNTTSITLGTSLGDVVTDILRTSSVPIVPPASGYPRFRIHLSGEGVVEIHLVKINTGGYAQITTDDDILTVELLSLSKDVVSVPPESSDDVIIERVISGAGDHHIDVLFIPIVNDELPFVGQGGALRKIVLCGFDEMAREIEIRSVVIDANCDQPQWKYTDEDESAWRNFGTTLCDGENGQDAPEAEFRLVEIDELCKQIQTRLIGDENWTVLGTVCDGEPGAPGETPECPDCEVDPGEDGGGVPEPEPEPEQDGACIVAAHVTDWILGLYSDTLEAFLEDVVGNGMSLLDFSEKIRAIIFANVPNPISAISNLLAWIAAQQAQDTVALLACANDAGTAEFLKCSLYCLLPESGDLTAQVLADWKAEILAETSIACRADLVAFMNSLALYQFRVEAVAAVTFDIAADCEACDCGCDVTENYLINCKPENNNTLIPSGWNSGQCASSPTVTWYFDRQSIIVNLPETRKIKRIRVNWRSGFDPNAPMATGNIILNGVTHTKTYSSANSQRGNLTPAQEITDLFVEASSFEIFTTGTINGTNPSGYLAFFSIVVEYCVDEEE